MSRLTVDKAVENFAVWSPDSERVVFKADRITSHDFVEKSVAGGPDRLVLGGPEIKNATDWSADGRFLLYRINDPQTSYDIWVLPMSGERRPMPLVRTNSAERDAQFSPDTRWIAYESNESGRSEVLIRRFSGEGASETGARQVSNAGGAQVRWRRDGRELFYIALDGTLMAVPMKLSGDGSAFTAGTPAPLFPTKVGGALQGINRQQYVVSEDGQQFLMNTIVDENATSPITLILNWAPVPSP